MSTPLHAHDSGLGLVRYNADGSPDQGFGHAGTVAERTPQGGLTPEALVIQTNGQIVLVGTSSDLATAAVGFGLARYNPDGTLDSGFGAAGRVLTRVGAATAEAHAVALQPDGDLVVAGGGFPHSQSQGAETGVSNFAVARYAPDGSLDSGFGTGGVVLTPMGASGAEARAIALQPDGRIVVAGTAFASGATNDVLVLTRFNADGRPDTSFGSGGNVITNFDDTGADPVRTAALIVQPDGKIVAVGSVGGHQGAFALARYLPNGDLDSAFGVGGTGKTVTRRESSAQAYAADIQADGKILVAGGVGPIADNVAFALARYGPTGDLDASFGSGGFVTTNFGGGGSGAHAVRVAADGKIMAVGSGYAASPSSGAVNGGFAVGRYLPDGAPDTSFGKGGVVLTTVGDAGSMPATLGAQSDGKLVVAGLTYFLVPSPNADRFDLNPLVVAPLAGLLIVLGAILVRQRRSRAKRSAGFRIGRGPAA